MTAPQSQTTYLTTRQKAEQLNVSPSWLEHDRMKPRPAVPFVRLGSRMVRYLAA